MSRKHEKNKPQAPHIAPQIAIDYSGYAYDHVGKSIPTPAQIRAMFGPAKTLGISDDDISLAMDSQLDSSGFYSLIQHAFDLGQPPNGNRFIGYAALSDLKQNGLVSACIETVTDDMVREWISFEFDEGKAVTASNSDSPDSGNDLTDKIEVAVKKFRLREVFREAAANTQYFGGCLIFIDTGLTDPATLKTPLHISDKSGELGLEKLRGFTVIEPINVFPGTYNSSDPLRRDYFQPLSWWVLGREVHASRFIKVSSGDVPVLLRPSYNFFGVPHAQILWDYVLHFQKNRVATSRMLGKYSDFIFKVSGLRDSMTTPSGTAWLDNKIGIMARYRSNDGIVAIDNDHEDIVKVESSLAGLVDITRQDLGFLCAINRTPAEKLLGEPPPGFNSTGESSIRNYYDHIKSQQEKLFSAGLETALQCVQLHEFGRIEPALTFSFNKLGGEDRQMESGIRQANTEKLGGLVMGEIVTAEGARAVIEANPAEYLPGLTDGIKADLAALEAMAEAGMEDGQNCQGRYGFCEEQAHSSKYMDEARTSGATVLK